MAEYSGSIELISGIKPKNNGNFPLVNAKDVQVDANGKRLDEKLAELGNGGGSGGSGEDGRGIVSITRTSGNGAAGTTDTYTITYTDNTKSTFTVYNGKDGTDGKTPVKGTDYWTDADKQEMISDVIASLPVYNGEVTTV